MSASPASSSVIDPPSPQTSTEAESVPFRRGVTESHTNAPSAHSLAWYSTIEYLADCNTPLPLLQELIKIVPNFYAEAPEQVLERIALRYLEALASKSMVAGTPDISQSAMLFLCQSVATPLDPCQPSGRRIAQDSDKIRQFISQTRSALPPPLIDQKWAGGIGFVLNENGELIAYHSAAVRACSAVAAEALALLEAITRRVMDLGIESCVFYSDCLSLVKWCMAIGPPIEVLGQ